MRRPLILHNPNHSKGGNECTQGFPIEIERGELGYVSRCPPFDVCSQGTTKGEVHRVISEAVQLFVEDAFDAGTLKELLEECGVDEEFEVNGIERPKQMALGDQHAAYKHIFFHRKRAPMSLMRFIRLALHSPKVTTRTEEDRRLADRRIVSRLSHGNIRLQRGEYVTREEIEEQYERVKSFDFDGE